MRRPDRVKPRGAGKSEGQPSGSRSCEVRRSEAVNKSRGNVRQMTGGRHPDPPPRRESSGPAASRVVHTLQVPPKPMLIFPLSTRTGTWRLPDVSRSISAMAWASALTSRKMTVNPSLALASRARWVNGQTCLPKMVISRVIAHLLPGFPGNRP